MNPICIDVYDDGCVAKDESTDGSYYVISRDCVAETYIATEKVIALQAEEYYREDEAIVGCKIITETKVFHAPKTISEVWHYFETVQGRPVGQMLEDVNSTLKLLHQWLRTKM
jgi:hypothetical protein